MGTTIKKVFNAMIKDKSIALNNEGKEFWKSHKKRVWKIKNMSTNDVIICDPNTHQIFEGVPFDQITIN